MCSLHGCAGGEGVCTRLEGAVFTETTAPEGHPLPASSRERAGEGNTSAYGKVGASISWRRVMGREGTGREGGACNAVLDAGRAPFTPRPCHPSVAWCCAVCWSECACWTWVVGQTCKCEGCVRCLMPMLTSCEVAFMGMAAMGRQRGA